MSKSSFTMQDEALDTATAASAFFCTCAPCKVSDEVLDAQEQNVTPCGTQACIVSDEVLDAQEQNITPCAYCRLNDGVHATF